MNLLLTGGCGYIGTSLAQQLLEDGHTVRVVDIQWFGNFLQPHPRLTVIQDDIRNASSWDLRGIDAVLHLANIANDACSDFNSKLSWEVNVLASMLLVERAITDGVKQFIFASSGSVYGIKEETEVTEELSLVPISDYNKTKMISERVLLSYANNICIQCIRPATVCGYSPRMRLDLSVNMLTLQALTNRKITVFGGDQTRPNIHLKDMIRVYQHFLEKGTSLHGVFNAGFENISILEIAHKINRTLSKLADADEIERVSRLEQRSVQKALDDANTTATQQLATAVEFSKNSYIPADIIITPSNDPRSYRLSSQKLLKTGFAPKYCVEDAILELISAYRKGDLKMEDRWLNTKVMLEIPSLK